MPRSGHCGQVLTDSMGYAAFTVTSAPQFSHLTILVSPGGGPIAIACIPLTILFVVFSLVYPVLSDPLSTCCVSG